MRNISLVIIIVLISFTPLLMHAQSSNVFYTGDGGSGMKLAVLEPQGRGLDKNEEYILPLIQGSMTADMRNFSSITIVDRTNVERIMQDLNQSLRTGLYSDDDYVRIGNATNARYLVTGFLTKTTNTYMLEFAVTDAETHIQIAAYPPTSVTFSMLENLSAVKNATADLLQQLGVNLTPHGINELKKPLIINQLQTETAIAQGLQAQRQENPTDAMMYYTQAIRNDPNNAEAYFYRGNLFVERKDYDSAIADYSDAIRIDPNIRNAYYNRGKAYSDKDDLDHAIIDYTSAIRVDPNYADAYNNRGLAYFDKGDLDRAVADYTSAIRINPNDAYAHYNRGYAYYINGDMDSAILDYTSAIRIDPNYSDAYNNRGNVYSDKSDLDLAIADYTSSIRIDPNNAMAYHNRGWSYRNQGNLDLAIADYTSAIRIYPNFASAYFNRGYTYYEVGNISNAISDFETVLRLEPENSQARENLLILRGR